MADKNYYGKCGSCKFCDLSDSDRLYTTKFRCTEAWNSMYVFADEKPCSKYEPDMGRSNETIERYVRGY